MTNLKSKLKNLIGIASTGLAVITMPGIIAGSIYLTSYKQIYSRKISGEEVSLYESGFLCQNKLLEVKKSDGKIFKYYDNGNDGKIEEFIIKDGEKITKYSNYNIDDDVVLALANNICPDLIEKEAIENAQRDFNKYSRGIPNKNSIKIKGSL